MERKIDKKDIINELNARTGFYKKNVKVLLDALEDVILENMQMATVDEPSEVKLFYGFVIGAKRKPAKQCRDPRNQELIESPEHLNPYTKFKLTFKKKVNNYEEGGFDVDGENDEEI
jgi:nucleoid DNA-binding protein